jgi:hypothetical protein
MKVSLEALLAQAVADEIGGEAEFQLIASRHPRTRNLEFQVQQVGREGPVGSYLLTGSIITPLDRKAGTDG